VPLIGEFDERTGRPMLKGRLLLQRFGVRNDVTFLVDTGADRTMLSGRDLLRLRLDESRFTPGPLMTGVGGIERTWLEPATVVFTDVVDGHIHVYRQLLVVALTRSAPQRLPSLLGRDIRNRWHMNYRPIERRLEFDVVSADDTFDLDV
jgi:hypothetical protein